MANRNFPSKFTYGFNLMPVQITGHALIAGTGSISTSTGQGIKAITRLAAGVYRIQLTDNYNNFLGAQISVKAPVTGSDVAAGSITPGVTYEITALGTTTAAQWITMGLPTGVAAAVGQGFVALATGGGTGTVKALAPSGVTMTEIVGDPQKMLQKQPFIQGSSGGAYITIRCLGPTSSSVTTMIPTDPVTGSQLYYTILMNNSSIQS